MLVRILSEWAGSPKCGTVADVPDALALDRIRTGWAEAVIVAAPPAPVIEAAIVAPVEREVVPTAKRRKGR
jgi:hypothetical protein